MWRMGTAPMAMMRTLSQAMTRALNSSLPGTPSTARIAAAHLAHLLLAFDCTTSSLGKTWIQTG